MLNMILKNLRKEKNITQEQLADILNVERSSIGKYESPNKPVIPSSDVLIRMSDYFGVSIDYLLGKTDIPNSTSQQSDIDKELDGIEFALYGEIRELDDNDKEELLRDVKQLRKLREFEKAEKEQGNKRGN